MKTESSNYEAVIGLEVHAQLSTDSKLFCGCSTHFGNPPNSNVCPICLGHPGVLPVLNQRVVEFALRLGLALNCEINTKSIFARKNYFYPDLPKGFQTSQYELPICEFGFLDLSPDTATEKKIGITRIHMEEDAGKSIHDLENDTLIDVNRCGVPLLEIVTEPDLRSASDAAAYLIKLRQIVQYLDICDGNMEEGSFRCDANVSVRLRGESKFGTKTEIKNMNSFKNVEKAIDFEIERQIEIIEDGGEIVQQTLLWDADRNEAFPMRSKEEAHDYRYFPEPDLMPVIINEEWLNSIKTDMPELPAEKKKKFSTVYSLPIYDADILTQSRAIADYFEETAEIINDFKLISNWIMGDILKVLNDKKILIEDFPIKPKQLAELLSLIVEGKISGKIAKEVFLEMLETSESATKIVQEKNLLQISDSSELEKLVLEVLNNNENQVAQFLNGEERVIGFFVGQIMKRTQGKANPKLVNDILTVHLNNRKVK
ncbi:MAG TPA: Asp-tRNA(Asn)/Glu-tRNA(Gln) amidotransferase subunit GatB [Ignavibacteriaceae bacterium]|nr:Asp-tRNA(Asn)/Glu-tRNA(Gln) amidotransferase subunit GatB [Ignavibacteriaceae bacterium]